VKPLILASKSPFRRQLMQNAGLMFESIATKIDERAIEVPLQQQGLDPATIAIKLASAKALNVSNTIQDAIIIGSDQTLSLENRQFHKPQDIIAAFAHLSDLSGKTHHLNSAIALAENGKIIWQHVSIAHMTMRHLSHDYIEKYLTKVGSNAISSVGAYQFEGEGVQLFERIEGDYFTIIGLPLIPLLAQLREIGAIYG
jgi:septum formation protein